MTAPNSRVAETLAAFRRGDLARARALAEAQLDGQRGPPEIHHLLGLIDCREGRLNNGIGHLRAALEAEPDNAAFRVMLARALVDAGRHAEALEIAAAPRDSSPPALALWHVRAEAAQAAGEHAEAAEAWAILCTARPDEWRSWANYGDSLAALERWEEAATALRRAWTLNPTELPIQQNLATALARSGNFDEAADQLRAMLDAGAEDVAIRLTLSRLLADLGRYQESMAELDRASRVAIGKGTSTGGAADLIRIALPDRSDGKSATSAELRALRELALLLERTNRMDELRRLLDDADAAGISRQALAYPAAVSALHGGDAGQARQLLALEDPTYDPVRRNRLLARILDALGDTDGAFAATDQMNRSVPDFDGWVARSVGYRRRLRALAEKATYWPARLRPLTPGPRPSPAFLVGFPRSGTTLLDTFLMGHPETQVLEEFPMLRKAEEVLGQAVGRPESWASRLEPARQAYFAELDRHVDPAGPALVVDKMPLNMLRLLLIYGLFPDAKVIFAQRHPCDAVLSGFMQSFTQNDAMACFLTIDGSADFYDAALSLFWASRAVLPVPIHDLIYEQLVADPEAALKPLIAFLGLDWRNELLDHRATAKGRGAIITPSYNQVVEPLTKAPSGRWRRYRRQLEPVLPILLPWAERFGYVD